MFELGTDGPLLILVAIDGSETSLRAGAYAAGMARRQHSDLAVVFAHAVGAFAKSVPGGLPAVEESNRETAEDLRRTIETESVRRGITSTFYERYGSPLTEVEALADELRADALVVGASTQAGHRFVGSLALQLVRAARWPVTVVP
jgi:nucleotide-binding universal stress UspA family protein